MAKKAYEYLKEAHTPCLVYQGRYNMLNRAPEDTILEQAESNGVGFVAFSPLAQGLLTDRYLHGIPEGSRMTHSRFLTPEVLTEETLSMIRKLNQDAIDSGYSLSQYALKWILRRKEVSSVIVGASSVSQLAQNLSIFK